MSSDVAPLLCCLPRTCLYGLLGIQLPSRDTRAELVRQQGRFLAIRLEMGCSVMLYRLRSFFAGIWFLLEDNYITLIHGFNNKQLLEPYLKVNSTLLRNPCAAPESFIPLFIRNSTSSRNPFFG